MDEPATAVLMADYNRWMNQRVYEAASSLSEAELVKERGAFFGSISGTLNHVAVADTIWLHRFAQQRGATALRSRVNPLPLPTSLSQPVAPSFAGLRAYREELDQIIREWADSLDAARLAAPLTYRNVAGREFTRKFGQLVQHFFNHQTHHRGQVSTLLFQAGIDIGVTDLVALIPEIPPGG